MERGVYFDAWFPRQHCYHPSLPARRMRMVDDLRDYHATMLVWAAMGGGSLSLPYLEEEAFAKIDPRFRFYGFVNDAEFVRQCQQHGIKVFGIVFEVQGWEFPVELNEAEDTILALNELRGEGKRGWLGLREFSQNRYPKLWAPIEHYFPGGLVNSDGQVVKDLIEECCSRDIFGEPCHALWVECPDREHQCFMMDRNNPVWREYLKAIIRIQIDAGVDGIQLDEAELPMTSFQYGGCFCKECMRGFREYLQNLPQEKLPVGVAHTELATFHYGQWLLAQGYDFKTNREQSPLYAEYEQFQRAAITQYFGELADYARRYAASQGREILVSGNFFNLLDYYYPLEPKVDRIITEMRNTRYRQPAWYRYVRGFAGDKPVVVVENPYGGVVPELIEKLKVGKGYDLFRMSLYEAAALGANMSVPYGAWMGSVIQDSFHPPHDLCIEIQEFLAENENLFSPDSYAELGVVYSVESNSRHSAKSNEFADNRLNLISDQVPPFWDACERLSQAALPYDVIMFPEGKLRPDKVTAQDLLKYRMLILPECRWLTPAQADALIGYVESGGRLLVIGSLGSNLGHEEQARLSAHANSQKAGILVPKVLESLEGGRQVQTEASGDFAIHIQKVEAGAAIHIIRYDYDEQLDCVPPLRQMRVEARLPGSYSAAELVAPSGRESIALEANGGRYVFSLHDVPLYCIVLLRREED